MSDYGEYDGNTEHDMWTDFTYHENTGELNDWFGNDSEYDEDSEYEEDVDSDEYSEYDEDEEFDEDEGYDEDEEFDY